MCVQVFACPVGFISLGWLNLKVKLQVTWWVHWTVRNRSNSCPDKTSFVILHCDQQRPVPCSHQHLVLSFFKSHSWRSEIVFSLILICIFLRSNDVEHVSYVFVIFYRLWSKCLWIFCPFYWVSIKRTEYCWVSCITYILWREGRPVSGVPLIHIFSQTVFSFLHIGLLALHLVFI